MIILKCDVPMCTNNTINFNEKIYTTSENIFKKTGMKHICSHHVQQALDESNFILDEQSDMIFCSDEVKPGDLNKITIFTDGACKGNPGVSASGIAVFKNNQKPVLYSSDYEELGTNNTAELKAFYRGLLIAENEKMFFNHITIKTDSQYTINSITKWAKNWKKNNWKKKNGEIKNLDLIKKIYEKYLQLEDILTVEYVKGHAGIEGNELSDEAANIGIEKKTIFLTEIS